MQKILCALIIIITFLSCKEPTVVDTQKDVIKATEKLDPDFHADQLDEITKLFDLVSKKGPDVDLQTLNTTVQYLQDAAKASYGKGGQIFTRGDKAAAAAKDAADDYERVKEIPQPDTHETRSDEMTDFTHRTAQHGKQNSYGGGKGEVRCL